MPQDNVKKSITKTSLYSWVWYKNTQLQLIAVAIIFVTVAMRVLPLEFQKRIINEAIGMKDSHKLFLYCGLYIGSVTFAGILKYIINLLQNYIGERTLLIIRKRLYEHVLSLPLSFYRKTSPGQVISYMITEFIPVATFIGSAVSIPLVNILTFFAMAGYMFYLNPLLGALSISIYPIEVFVIPQIQKFFNRANRDRIENTQKVSGIIGEAITGVHEVHSNASIPLESGRFSGALQRLYKATLQMNALKFGIKFVNNFFQSLGPFILFLVGGYLAIKGRFDLGALVAFLSAYEKLYDPWKELMEFYQNYQDSSVRYKQVMSGFDLHPEFALECEGREPYHLDNEIVVKDVSFVVNGNIKLLDNVSMVAKPGEHVALVGFSGSGKSTLALCIAQLNKYTGGSITIGGREVADLSKQDMTYNLGMVAQHPFIFNGTVRENLLYSCEALAMQGGACGNKGEEPSLDKLIELTQQVGLFLDVLSFGLRSVIDPKEHPDLVEAIIAARREFRDSHADDLKNDVEFLNKDNYLFYSSVSANIVYGAANKTEYERKNLYKNPIFVKFLEQHGLLDDLVVLATNMTHRVVDVLSGQPEGSDLFKESPISYEMFDEYRALTIRLERGDAMTDEDRAMLLRVALACTPAMHKLGSMTPELAEKIVAAREPFREMMESTDPEAFTFFHSDAYMASRSIQDNIVSGRVKNDSAGAEDRINQRIMQLLIMEGVLEQVVEMGLFFEVGSMGDRLSGGQRQKIALARTFLKNPAIIILDEATAALDNASQARVQNMLTRKFKGKSTVLAVIHRLDILKNYDKVVVLKAGKVMEQGGYNELIEKQGALYELVYGKK